MAVSFTTEDKSEKRMMGTRHLLVLTLALWTSPCPALASDSDRQPHDLVVFGKLKTESFESLDDLGLNARITAKLRVTRIVTGHIPSRTITVHYIAHSDWPRNREIRLHLQRSPDGTYLVCGARGYICQ